VLADWARDAQAALRHGPAALVSILAVAGSTPRGAGTRMVVGTRDTRGTIGGGVLEHRAIAAARALLARPPGSWTVHDYVLGAGRRVCPGPLGCARCGCAAASGAAEVSLPQCCGGRARVLLEHLDPAEAHWLHAMTPGRTLVIGLDPDGATHAIDDAPVAPLPAKGALPGVGEALRMPIGARPRPLYLFGAGHVGRAIAHTMHGLPFELHWFDSRADEAADAGARHGDDTSLEAVLTDAPRDAIVLILTHDHGLDYRLTHAALAHPIPFVGLIGSASKRARFLSQLRRDGVSEDALARLICPIGLPGITGKEPAVIAIAVAAQLLTQRTS
jgi:xanthine dehydrogenase accessory factor